MSPILLSAFYGRSDLGAGGVHVQRVLDELFHRPHWGARERGRSRVPALRWPGRAACSANRRRVSAAGRYAIWACHDRGVCVRGTHFLRVCVFARVCVSVCVCVCATQHV